VSEELSPQKPPPLWIVWHNAIDSEKYLGYAIGYNMSSLQDMSNFLFISMTGPKVAQRIQVSILL